MRCTTSARWRCCFNDSARGRSSAPRGVFDPATGTAIQAGRLVDRNYGIVFINYLQFFGEGGGVSAVGGLMHEGILFRLAFACKSSREAAISEAPIRSSG